MAKWNASAFSGTLDIETKLALHRAHYEGKVIVANYGGGEFEVWPFPKFFNHLTYRLQPGPLRDISLPWAALDASWQWAARDESGGVWIYDERPDIGIRVWITNGLCLEITGLLANFDPGNKPWNESLISRPSMVEVKP